MPRLKVCSTGTSTTSEPVEEDKEDTIALDDREFVIKCCLRSHLHKPEVIPYINKLVTNVSKIACRGAMLANHFFLNHLQLGSNLKLDANLINQIFTVGTTNFLKPKYNILQFYKNNKYLYPNIERITGDRQSITYMSNQYMVNLTNHLVQNFERRQNKFIHFWLITHMYIPKSDDYFYKLSLYIKYHINNWKYKYEFEPTQYTQHEKYAKLIQDFIKMNRDNLANTTENINKTWMKMNLFQVMKYNYFILQQYEKYNSKPGVIQQKLFNLVPMNGLRNHFITIDTKVLYHIMRESKLFKDNFEEFKSNKLKVDEHYRTVFNIDNLLTKKRQETYEISHTMNTDGVALCVHYKPIKKRKKN